MSVQTVDVILPVPKESKEVLDLILGGVVVHLLSGKKVADLLDLFPQGMIAADGSLKIPEEMASDFNDELAGYGVQQLFSALKTKKPVVQA